MRIPILVLLLSLFASPAFAQQPKAAWDSKGWVQLGERSVDRRVDRDRIDVGKQEGQFGKLTVVVLDSDLEMIDFTINFGDGTTYSPKLQHFFKEGQRTRAFELPPSAKVISHIDVKYKNMPGDRSRARVQIWGWKTGNNPAPAPAWDSKGWTMLGEREVNRNVDRDRIEVGRYEGKFNKLTMVVSDSDLELLDFTITFGDRTTYSPKLKHSFKEGQRTRAFDLPPSARVISHIDLKYRNTPGGGRAKVQIFGKGDGVVATPAQVTMPQWDQRGWTMLGERQVDGRVDNDRIDVGRYEGKFTKLQIVVLDSELELIDFAVKFGKGPEWRPTLRQYFREGSRTHAIDFPGDERTIKHVEFKYRNLPGGGRARIQVWGLQRAGDAPSVPAGQIWDNRGWTMLGERAVQGGRKGDKDKIIVGRNEGKFRKLMLVVVDSDLEMVEMTVKFGRGAPLALEVNQFFRENTRTRAIDLPGDDRVIKWIEFRYKNLPGGGRAKVQVWAK